MLNFVKKKKKVIGCTCLSLLERELGAPKIDILKYYNVRKQESRFTLGLDDAKNTHFIQKWFQ